MYMNDGDTKLFLRVNNQFTSGKLVFVRFMTWT
jgi:hypothetical protein